MKEEYMDRKEIFEQIENSSDVLQKMFENSVDDSKNYGQRVNCMVLEYIVSQNLRIDNVVVMKLNDILDYLSNGQKSIQKLKILQLLNEIIRQAEQNDRIFEILCNQNIMLILLQLIDRNRRLNIMHIQIEKIINTILMKDDNIMKVSMQNME